jgi:signal transduction histidine kinase
MSFYFLIPLLSSLASAMLGSALLARDPRHPANRRFAVLMLCAAFWAGCEVVWNTRQEASVVLALVRLSALGWIWVGPLGLHLILELVPERRGWPWRLLPALYALAAGFLVLTFTTSLMHTGVQRESWGWTYGLGPAYPFFYLLTIGSMGLAIVIGARAFRSSASPAERSQAHWLILGIVTPLSVASLTDGILPMFAIQVPHLGTASFAALGVMVGYTVHRYGYSVLAPGAFAREILDTLPDGVALLRLDGRVRSANGGLARLLGTTPIALEGVRIAELLAGAPVDPPREVEELETELRPQNGGRPIPVSLSSTLLRDKQSLPIGLVLVARDLREVMALRHRLLTSGRLAAVGELVAGIAHEINNPMAFVRANLGLLREHWARLAEELEKAERAELVRDIVSEGEEMIEESLEGVDRAAAIVRDVKGFSHSGRGERELADLNLLLESVLRVAAPQLRHRARIERRYGAIPLVRCAPQELKQVFLNLVLNAGQAVGEDGLIRVTTDAEPDAVTVCVEDNGCGIARELIDRIFDPFFTTKAVGEGTGLGLSISYQIVRKHDGDIEVESEPGRGTSIRVRLPI